MYILVGDQSPKLKSIDYWTYFFGIEVPVFVGAEKLAKKLNYPIFYMKTKKIKRGYYQTTMQVLSNEPRNIPNYKITDDYIHILENQIREQPEYYYWTHKRFKHIKNNTHQIK